MFNRILDSFNGSRRRNSRKATRNYVGGCHTRLRHEQLEDRAMLATLTVSVNGDGSILPNDGNLTLREAIAYVNGDAEPLAGDLAHISGTIGQNDKIVFDSSLNDATIELDWKRGHSTFS
jgi:hypothetical protein